MKFKKNIRRKWNPNLISTFEKKMQEILSLFPCLKRSNKKIKKNSISSSYIIKIDLQKYQEISYLIQNAYLEN